MGFRLSQWDPNTHTRFLLGYPSKSLGERGDCNLLDGVWSPLSSQGLFLKTEVLCGSSLADVLLGEGLLGEETSGSCEFPPLAAKGPLLPGPAGYRDQDTMDGSYRLARNWSKC